MGCPVLREEARNSSKEVAKKKEEEMRYRIYRNFILTAGWWN
ncbi:MAG: hypothetical protein N2234_07305 [Planctomycetota bacterium]|nr:hypothetical protein [Planctomycetota bacterium]